MTGSVWFWFYKLETEKNQTEPKPKLEKNQAKPETNRVKSEKSSQTGLNRVLSKKTEPN